MSAGNTLDESNSATGSEEKRTKLENTATLQQNQQTAIQSEKILERKEKRIRGNLTPQIPRNEVRHAEDKGPWNQGPQQ